MCTVFQCRKCGHLLYAVEDQSFPEKLQGIAVMACSNCGEEDEGLWALRGRAKCFMGKIIAGQKGGETE